jgi:hypothetical protein
MYNRKVYFSNNITLHSHSPAFKRYFFNLVKKSDNGAVAERPGALPPVAVKRQIEKIGPGKVVKIQRIGFDGTEDETPIIVEVQSIYKDGFSGKVLTAEKGIIENGSDKVIYAKNGGGIIRFNYLDGDIKYVSESQVTRNVSSERNIAEMVKTLANMGVEERILVKYYDRRHRGTVNVEGVLVARSSTNTAFKMIIDKINNIELDAKFSQQFDVEREMVLDILTV